MTQTAFDPAAQRVIVTGGAGFLGSHLVNHLRDTGTGEIIVPRSAEYDLREKAAVKQLFADNPGVTQVIHLAATVGGIGANREFPGRFFYDNIMMGTILMEEARLAGVQKVHQHWHHLRISQNHPCTFQRRKPVGWLP